MILTFHMPSTGFVTLQPKQQNNQNFIVVRGAGALHACLLTFTHGVYFVRWFWAGVGLRCLTY